MKLTLKNEVDSSSIPPSEKLVAYKGDRRIGAVECNNDMTAHEFSYVYGGLGDVYHCCGEGNPFLRRHWGEVFENPELLPPGTLNVFLDEEE